MNLRRFWKLFIMCLVAISCLGLTGAAKAEKGTTPMESLNREMLEISIMESSNGQIVTHSTGELNMSISANRTSVSSESYSLAVGETVTFDCSYVPRSASMDFGLIAPDGYFYYINVTNGSIRRSIEVDQQGSYYLAIRNNSSSTVTVVGTVNY